MPWIKYLLTVSAVLTCGPNWRSSPTIHSCKADIFYQRKNTVRQILCFLFLFYDAEVWTACLVVKSLKKATIMWLKVQSSDEKSIRKKDWCNTVKPKCCTLKKPGQSTDSCRYFLEVKIHRRHICAFHSIHTTALSIWESSFKNAMNSLVPSI